MLKKQLGLEYRDLIRGSVDNELPDPPYSIRLNREYESSDHNWLSADDMKAMVRLYGHS